MNDGLPEAILGEFPDRCEFSRGHEQDTLAVVVGSAPCRDQDFEKLNGFEFDVIAVNYSGIVLERVDHWISIHGDMMPEWLDTRTAAGRDLPGVIVGNFMNGNHDKRLVRWEVRPYPGSSSLFAVRWALFWGYRRIVLCGVPLAGRHSLLPDGSMIEDPRDYNCYHEDWIKQTVRDIKPLPLDGYVRSMSGWTREHFGAPTKEFLEA